MNLSKAEIKAIITLWCNKINKDNEFHNITIQKFDVEILRHAKL